MNMPLACWCPCETARGPPHSWWQTGWRSSAWVHVVLKLYLHYTQVKHKTQLPIVHFVHMHKLVVS